MKRSLQGKTFLLIATALAATLLAGRCTNAQQTVFNVPSADVLDKGKVYGEMDGTLHFDDTVATFTPRVVYGIGHRVEIGMNFNGLTAPTMGELVVSPTVKWRVWESKNSDWTFFVGDDLFFPVYQRSYDAGNYVYGTLSKSWKSGTRIGLGAYDFTKSVVSNGNRAGGQFTIEQAVGKKLTLAADWYTGASSVGYVTPGANYKLTKKLTLYGAYQIGNSGLTQGNHMFLWEIGYNFN